MNWIFKQSDKRKHFTLGLIGAFILFYALMIFMPGTDLIKAIHISFVAAWFIGCLKEERDRRDPKNHTEEARDSFATSLGGFIGSNLGGLSHLIFTSLMG